MVEETMLLTPCVPRIASCTIHNSGRAVIALSCIPVADPKYLPFIVPVDKGVLPQPSSAQKSYLFARKTMRLGARRLRKHPRKQQKRRETGYFYAPYSLYRTLNIVIEPSKNITRAVSCKCNKAIASFFFDQLEQQWRLNEQERGGPAARSWMTLAPAWSMPFLKPRESCSALTHPFVLVRQLTTCSFPQPMSDYRFHAGCTACCSRAVDTPFQHSGRTAPAGGRSTEAYMTFFG